MNGFVIRRKDDGRHTACLLAFVSDGSKEISGNTTVFLHKESWVSPLRLIRLLIVMFVCALVALVCTLVTTGK